MILGIFGKPRVGKTAYMTYLLIQVIFDRTRIRKMRKAIERMNAGGFAYTVPQHCVVANYDITAHKLGYRPRHSRRINPYRLGYKNDYVDTHFLEPYTAIGITEAQKYFNSRMSAYYPDWQSRFFEQHGHNDYDVYMDVQRPNLIDINIRALAAFTEIRKATDLDGNPLVQGKPVNGIIWTVRHFDGNDELERYFASGKTDSTTYTEEIVKVKSNIFNCYNSQMCKPKFYDGHLRSDFDTREAEPLEETFDGYVKYLQEMDDELPTGFYQLKGR